MSRTGFELTREARMQRIRMNLALAVVVIPSLLLMTAVLPKMLSFSATGISTEMSRPSIEEFDEAYMTTFNVRVGGVVLWVWMWMTGSVSDPRQ